MKILVSGFDPFGGEKINPAIESVKLLPDEIKGAKIIKLEIPTVAGKSLKKLEEVIEIEKSLTNVLPPAKPIVMNQKNPPRISRMPNPYTKKEHHLPLTPRSTFLKTAEVESKKETSHQYTDFVCSSSGPPHPGDYSVSIVIVNH